MSGSTISTTVTSTVTLGSASYTSPLTIAATAAILPFARGSVGLYAAAAGAGGAVTNAGTIKGATQLATVDINGFAGGQGVRLVSAVTFTNTGYIAGAAGGNAAGTGFTAGDGGAGVYLNGGTLIDAGTIAGGAGGLGYAGAGNGAAADAVLFGTAAGTLVVEKGATFIGNVVADASVADVLELYGSSTAALSGGGTQFQYFNTIDFASGASWTIAGNLSGLADGQVISGFSQYDTIVLDNFTAKLKTYVSGVGLELSGGSPGSATLDLTGGNPTAQYTLTDDGTNTTIGLLIGTISTYRAGVVTIGAGDFFTTIDVTNKGTVTPFTGQYGLTAIYAASGVTTPSVVNAGSIGGGNGHYYGSIGGGGISFSVAGAITNEAGQITGGKGGTGGESANGNPGGDGGNGVLLLSGGTVTNASGALIAGGAGGQGGHATGYSKNGQYYGTGGTGGVGGTGVSMLKAGTISNSGIIRGGAGGNGGSGLNFDYGTGGLGGTGVVIDDGAVLQNASGATVAGGTGGQVGVSSGGGSYPGKGGTGVNVTSATVINAGTIAGGNAGGNYLAAFIRVAGGTGIEGGDEALISNASTGLVEGGAGGRQGGAGGTGIELTKSATLDNAGTVLGGTGYNGNLTGGFGGPGGVGVVVLATDTVNNSGAITGGTGGQGYDGASGGFGVQVTDGLLINGGAINGGAAGENVYAGNQPMTAPAVYISGGTVIDSGVLASGGPDAVTFGPQAGTLELEPGVSITGSVAANSAVADVLKLVGSSSSTLAGIGTQFTGFKELSFDTGAAWTIAGNAAGLASGATITGLSGLDRIVLDGFAATGAIYNSGTGLVLSKGGQSVTLDITGSGSAFFTQSDGTNTTIGPTVGTLSNVYTVPIEVGGFYFSPTLNISGSGTVAPSGSGLTAVYTEGPATITNNGVIKGGAGSSLIITGTGGIGVSLSSLAIAALFNYGTITGGAGGHSSSEPAGAAGGAGVYAAADDLVLNTGLIEGGSGGTGKLVGAVAPGGAGVVLNGGILETSGTIAGGYGADAVYFTDTTSQLIIDPGARFIGDVVAKDTLASSLFLNTNSSAATFDMGGTVNGFANIVFATSGTWTLEGSVSELTGAVGSLTAPRISGFVQGDQLIVEGFAGTTRSISSSLGITTLALSNGTTTVGVAFAGSSGGFTVQDVGGETEITLCFLRRTLVMTPSGERAVEALRAGDEVVTRFAGTQRIKWIGRQDYSGDVLAREAGRRPVRIAPGALGDGLPRVPLWLSPGHSVLLDGVLVLAESLVNGITVTQDEVLENVSYYAIELERHDCVLAAGAWAESFADGPGLRAQFHNGAEFHALFPGYVMPEAITLCAPRPEEGPALEAALAPVAARAAALAGRGELRGFVDVLDAGGRVEGWAQDAAAPELQVTLEILAGEEVVGQVLACQYRDDLAAAGLGRGRCAFRFEGGRARPTGVRRAGGGRMLPFSAAAGPVRA